MAFPVTFTSRIVETLQGDSQWITDVLRTRVAIGLEKEGASKIISEKNHISFQGRFLDPFVWNWRPLSAVSSGKVTINHDGRQLRLTYSISFGGAFSLMLLLGSFIVVTVFFPPWKMPFDTMIRVYGWWSCLVVADYLISVALFRSFIHKLFREFIDLARSTDGRPGIQIS